MSLQGKTETIANVATICVAALLSVVLVKAYLLPALSPASAPKAPQIAPTAVVGTDLKGRLPGVDWSKNGRTLVLAISTTCHYCRDSQPFYRKLQERLGKDVKIMAVLPQPISEAERYLSAGGVHVDGIRQASLANIGVTGTPTMLLVDSSGVITKIWIGAIQPVQQEQVLNAIKKG